MTMNYISKAFLRILTVLITAAMLITSMFSALVQKADALDKRLADIESITWELTGVNSIGNLEYHVRKIVAVNGVSVDSSEDMKSSYAYCVEPLMDGPDSECGTGDTYTAGMTTAGGHGELIYTFDGSEAADEGFSYMRKLCYYLPSGYGWTKTTSKWWDSYRASGGSDISSAYILGATVLSKRWAKDADNPEGNANYGYNKLGDKSKALVDRFLNDVSALPDPPENYIAFFVSREGRQDIWGSLYATEYGSIKVTKATALPGITDGNDCYSLAGAEFTVYKDEGCTYKASFKDGSTAVIKTKADGSSDSYEIETGDYYIRETKAPAGYALDANVTQLTITRDTTYTYSCKDEPITDLVELLITKNPVDYPHDQGEGDATLKGAVYKFSYHDKLSGANAADPAVRIWHFVTDEHGRINGRDPAFAEGFTSDDLYKDREGEICYPLGTYLIQEVKAPEGYLVNDEILEVTITEDGTDNIHVKTYNEKIKGDDTIIRGGVKLAKIDNDLDEAYAQGDATLKGAEFTIYNQSAETVMVKGKEIGKGDAALVITTNADGIATSGDHDLPYGSYLVKETKPSKGYLLNTEWSRSFRIREDGVIIDLTEDKVREAVIRGGVQIIKRDKELVKSEALGGAHLDGIVMTIKNVTGRDVVVRKDLDNKTDKIDWKKLESKKDFFESEAIKRVPTGKDVGKITVHWNEEKKAYTAETLADDLPYGTYTIRESKTNESYQRTDKTEHMFTIREDGVMVSFDDNQNEMALTFDDYVYRSDVQGTKIADSTSERFSYVPFKIISVTNGETHVVVTDANGFFSTKDRRAAGDIDEDEEADTARKQNPFDDLLEAKDIKTADLEKRSQDILHGVWFGTGEFGDKAKMNSKFGALPYDSYILEEMPCEHNEGYILQKFYFTVDQKAQNGFVDLETITDDVPEIGTTATVNGKNKDIRPQKEITLVDVIEYKNLKKGEIYTAKGVLMDKATKEPVLDINGNQITAEQEFKTFMSNGKVKVTFTFDATSLYGKDTVVFEKVYDAEGHVAAKHEEIDDEGQTVTWEPMKPAYEMHKIRTTKAPSKGDKYGFFAQDEVEYEVHVENTGNIVLTMDVSDQFTQNPEFFTVPKLKDVKFDGEGTWNNKGKDEFIANITLESGEKAVVTYTAVVNDNAKEYLAAKSKDSDSLDDKGHDTNRVYQKNKTDDKDGYWNTAECENVKYPNPDKPDEPGTLEPKDDVAQTPVQTPEIGTTLTGNKKAKEVDPCKETTLTDVVEYKALDPSKWYMIEGTLMIKDTGDTLVEHGHEVTVWSEPFKPKKPNGKVEVTFVIDTRNLKGKELVAFETAYRINDYDGNGDLSKTTLTQVAEHKDLKDKGQTVLVKDGPEVSPPPKTGDNTMLWLYGGLFAAAFGSMLALVIKEYIKKRKQDKEDAEMFV